jgi:hypothetical protein
MRRKFDEERFSRFEAAIGLGRDFRALYENSGHASGSPIFHVSIRDGKLRPKSEPPRRAGAALFSKPL